MDLSRCVFVDIDTQHDFMDPSGALYVAGAIEIRPILGKLARFARDEEIPVIATACAHEPEDAALEPFPPHCLKGTWGQERIEETRAPASLVIAPGEGYAGPTWHPHVTIEKRVYDPFSEPAMRAIIEGFAAENPLYIVMGVATDYCVKAAVLGLRERNCRVQVVTDAIRAVDPETEQQALDEFVACGAELVTSDRFFEAG